MTPRLLAIIGGGLFVVVALAALVGLYFYVGHEALREKDRREEHLRRPR